MARSCAESAPDGLRERVRVQLRTVRLQTATMAALAGAAVVVEAGCIQRLTDGVNEFDFVTRHSSDDPYFFGAILAATVFLLAMLALRTLGNKRRALRELAAHPANSNS